MRREGPAPSPGAGISKAWAGWGSRRQLEDWERVMERRMPRTGFAGQRNLFREGKGCGCSAGVVRARASSWGLLGRDSPGKDPRKRSSPKGQSSAPGGVFAPYLRDRGQALSPPAGAGGRRCPRGFALLQGSAKGVNKAPALLSL